MEKLTKEQQKLFELLKTKKYLIEWDSWRAVASLWEESDKKWKKVKSINFRTYLKLLPYMKERKPVFSPFYPRYELKEEFYNV